MPWADHRIVWALGLVWMAGSQAPPGRSAAADGGDPSDAVGAAFSQDSAEVRATIAASGGSLELPGFARVYFSPTAFASSRVVTLGATRSVETAVDFETTVPVPVLARGARELRILTGPEAPRDTVEVTIRVPDEVRSALARGGVIAAYAQIWQSGGQELLDGFVRVPAYGVTPPGVEVGLRLAPTAFTDRRRTDGQFEAIVVIAATRRR